MFCEKKTASIVELPRYQTESNLEPNYFFAKNLVGPLKFQVPKKSSSRDLLMGLFLAG